jgi:hypothetical protein
MKRVVLGGRVQLSSPDVWPLLVSSLVPSCLVPFAICIHAAADTDFICNPLF